MGRNSTIAGFCVVRGDKKGDKMKFVQFMDCVFSLNAVDDRLGCVCLRLAAAEDGET